MNEQLIAPNGPTIALLSGATFLIIGLSIDDLYTVLVGLSLIIIYTISATGEKILQKNG